MTRPSACTAARAQTGHRLHAECRSGAERCSIAVHAAATDPVDACTAAPSRRMAGTPLHGYAICSRQLMGQVSEVIRWRLRGRPKAEGTIMRPTLIVGLVALL